MFEICFRIVLVLGLIVFLFKSGLIQFLMMRNDMRITKLKYFNESGTINVTVPRKPEQPLPGVRDLLTFGSARRWMVTNTEPREDTLWVWLGSL